MAELPRDCRREASFAALAEWSLLQELVCLCVVRVSYIVFWKEEGGLFLVLGAYIIDDVKESKLI